MIKWVLGLTFMTVAIFAVDSVIRRRRKRARGQEAAKCYREASLDQREAVLVALTRNSPETALGWYLLGAMQLRGGRIREAARSFGMAHHRECNLESAALLTFACLKAREGEDCDLIEQVLTTWVEMRRPDLAASAEDRRAMECLAEPDCPEGLTVLGKLLWSVCDGANRARLMAAISDRNEQFAALRT